jgi:phosphogluconate dehydratase
MEVMGLHLPGSAVVPPDGALREALTARAATRALEITAGGSDYTPLCHVLSEEAFVNGIVGLMATGGSTNLVLHLPAMARAAGIVLDLEDFAALSEITPLVARVYPNGLADVNHFHAAGGMGLLIRELLKHGLLHEDILTIADERGMNSYTKEPKLKDGELVWEEGTDTSLDPEVISTVENPFGVSGGLHVMKGNLGRGVSKISAVAEEHQIVEAPAMVFNDQDDVVAAFKRGEMEKDVIVVLCYQGPKSNGMPELHKLTPPLGVLQDKGFKVGLVTDGRMSGASGKVPSAIHMSPECADGSNLSKVRDGDIISLNTQTGELNVKVDQAELDKRSEFPRTTIDNKHGMGRELFENFRNGASTAEQGASNFFTI